MLHYTFKQQQKNQKNELPFQNGGQIADFASRHFDFSKKKKIEKPLFQRNFSMKFGSQW